MVLRKLESLENESGRSTRNESGRYPKCWVLNFCRKTVHLSPGSSTCRRTVHFRERPPSRPFTTPHLDRPLSPWLIIRFHFRGFWSMTIYWITFKTLVRMRQVIVWSLKSGDVFTYWPFSHYFKATFWERHSLSDCITNRTRHRIEHNIIYDVKPNIWLFTKIMKN